MRIHEKDFPLPGEVAPIPLKETFRQRGKKKDLQFMKEIKVETSATGEFVIINEAVPASSPPTGARKRKQAAFGSSSSKKRFKDRNNEIVVLNPPVFLGSTGDARVTLPTVNNRVMLVRTEQDILLDFNANQNYKY